MSGRVRITLSQSVYFYIQLKKVKLSLRVEYVLYLHITSHHFFLLSLLNPSLAFCV